MDSPTAFANALLADNFVDPNSFANTAEEAIGVFEVRECDKWGISAPHSA